MIGVTSAKFGVARAFWLGSMCWLLAGFAAHAQAGDPGLPPEPPPTIDRMTFTGSGGTYSPSQGLDLLRLTLSESTLSGG